MLQQLTMDIRKKRQRLLPSITDVKADIGILKSCFVSDSISAIDRLKQRYSSILIKSLKQKRLFHSVTLDEKAAEIISKDSLHQFINPTLKPIS